MFQEQLQQFEFPVEVPNEVQRERIILQTLTNRQLVLSQCEKFGLDPDVISAQGPFLIGPFFSPGPIPTSFGGRLDQFQRAMAIGEEMAQQIRSQMKATSASLVTLDMTEIPKGGAEQMDVYIVPKNGSENKRVKLAGKVKYGTPYALAQTPVEDLTQAANDILGSMNIAMQRNKLLKRYKDEIRAMISEDLLQAIDTSQEQMRYIDFAATYNTQITKRVTGTHFPVVSVDTEYYSPFIREGISDIGRFLNMLDSVGFFRETASLFKVVDSNLRRSRMINAVDGNGRVQFADTEEELDFSELKERFSQIAPSKELSYVMCFGQFVPVLYGCDNRSVDGYYKPYEMAKQQLQQLGLSPTMYRTQDRMSYDYNAQGTIFDFYTSLITS